MGEHLVNHKKHGDLICDNTLHVIGVIENPMRYNSRYRLFREWYEAMLATPNTKVYVVECAYGERHFEVTDPNNPQHLQLRTTQPIWHKESMQNLSVKHLLPQDWKYVCTSDCDIFFDHNGWAQEALHQMQDYSVIQPWSDCVDLGFRGRILKHFKSFCYQHQKGVPKQTHPAQPYEYAHSGFAWCYRRDFYEAVQQWIDFAILGSADHHQAFSLINEADRTIKAGMNANFFKLVYAWQFLAYRHTKGQLGYVPGFIKHKHHGPKADRRYRERWDILIHDHYDPVANLVHDTQGLIKVIGNPKLIHDCRKYMLERNEDDICD